MRVQKLGVLAFFLLVPLAVAGYFLFCEVAVK